MMEMKYYLESAKNGKTMIHVLDDPGCMVKGLTPEDAIQRLSRGVESYMMWRRSHGFSVPDDEYRFVLAEEQTGGPFHPRNRAAFFNADEQIVSDSERETWLTMMAANRKDLLLVLESLSSEDLDLYIESSDWSIRDIVRHIASAERFYITRLFPKGHIPRSKPSKDIYQRIHIMRENCVRILRDLTAEELTKKVLKGKEYWTARKVFRRFLEHEREHMGQILRIIQHHNLILEIPLAELKNKYQGISWKEDGELTL